MDKPEGNAPTHVWERFDSQQASAGRVLSDLRTALRSAPGAEPRLWRYYTTLNTKGSLTSRLMAEHAAIGLFGKHQQSKSTLMHQKGRGLGEAMRCLAPDERSPGSPGVQARLRAIAYAPDIDTLVAHLDSIVAMLRGPAIPLDYTLLCTQIRLWSWPESRERVLRTWGGGFRSARSDRDGAPAHNVENGALS